MSASQLIDEIKSLPAEEREQVVEFVKTLEKQESEPATIHHEKFEAAADAVFRKHREALRRLAQ